MADVWPKPGDQMVFLSRNGYDHQLEAARKVFSLNQIVTVKAIDVGDWSHSIEFEEAPGRFNGVMFELLTEELTPEVEEEQPKMLLLSPAERDTILAALRFWQNDLVGESPDNAMLDDIATDGGAHDKLDDEAIDALCDRINC